MSVPDHVHNERTKLFANALNTAATSSFTVGILAPIAASIYTSATYLPVLTLSVAFTGWIMAATGLHFMARRVLRKLKA